MFLNKYQRFLSTIKQFIVIFAVLFSGQLLAAEQVITPSTSDFNITNNTNIAFDVNYETRGEVDETLTGIGLRVHFDSSKISLGGLTSIFDTGHFNTGNVEPDDADLDNDANTDKLVIVVWFDFNGKWPGEGNTPAMLYNAAFNINAGFSGTTKINFSADTVPGYTLAFTPITLTAVVDQAPVFGAVTNVSTEATANLTAVTLLTPTVTDNEDGALTPTLDNAGPYPVGTSTVVWTAIDSGSNQVTASQTITITDATGPVIDVPNTQTVEATANLTPVTLNAATATDLVDGSVTVTTTSTGPYAVGTHTITWTATDVRSNRSTATSSLVITDTTPPTLTAPTDITQESATGDPIDITLPTVLGTDLVDGQLTAIADNTGPFAVGETRVIWTAIDSAGNSATATHHVIVTITDAIPVIAVNNSITAEATGILTPVALTPPL
ncbi:MAG: HYR domain-containing protein, partial [Psychrosphaera sp.]|nr:HYR domain-containing protein [Psychrosphaera sp.]